MLCGLLFPNAGACGDARTLAEFAHIAEENGWDGIFLEDYVVWQSRQDVPTYDPWIALAAMAVRTKRIRIGTTVTPLARRRPWQVARQSVTIDYLSNGRLILGVGLGDSSDISFTRFGEVTDAKRRAKILDEALQLLIGLWGGEPFSFSGEFFKVDEVTFLPRPVQSPRIPIWIGGRFRIKGVMERAARWDGANLFKLNNENWTPDELRELKAYVESHRTSSTPYDIVASGQERTADPEKDRALMKSFADAGANWWIEYIRLADPKEMRASIERGPLTID